MRNVLALLLFGLSVGALADEVGSVAVPTLNIGTVESLTRPRVVDTKGPELTTCASLPADPANLSLPGEIVLQVTVRRGRVELVTVASAAEAYDWLTPCVKQELAAYSWPVRSETLRVPVTVEP